MAKITTTVQQHRGETREGNEKLITTVRMGPHVVQTVEYASNGGYYVVINGQNIKLRR